jgi:hypothetical protein
MRYGANLLFEYGLKAALERPGMNSWRRSGRARAGRR